MHETAEDLAELQGLIDASYASAGEHIRSIFRPELRSSAEDIARALTGIFIINLATVTANCEPLVAPVDGSSIEAGCGSVCLQGPSEHTMCARVRR